MTNASTDPYNSGYDHGCNDAGISDPSDRYINQPEKGPSFHTDTFMQGYYDGYDACSHGTENVTSPDIETFKIDATINLDRQAILEANGSNLGDAWFTVNGQRYGEGTYYDMTDWVYDDDVEICGINTNSLSRVLELPYSLEPGQDIQVCLDDDKGYHICDIIVNSEEKRPEKVNFTYP
ncbi:MAG TPA: hypothetical protein VE130_12830 [Nitrososphaeraceae archaeon]|nr:hypothetical protein [Nitrososphaeraceae archaeon]